MDEADAQRRKDSVDKLKTFADVRSSLDRPPRSRASELIQALPRGGPQEHNLTYPLLSDVDGQAAKAYGVSKRLLGLTPGASLSFSPCPQSLPPLALTHMGGQGRETFFINKDGRMKGSSKSFTNAR